MKYLYLIILVIILANCREDYSFISLNLEKNVNVDTRENFGDSITSYPNFWNPTPIIYNDILYFIGVDMKDSILKSFNSKTNSIEYTFDCSESSNLWTLQGDDELLFFIPYKPDSILLVSYYDYLLINGDKILKKVKRDSIMGGFYFVCGSGSDNYKDYIQDKIPFVFGGDYRNPEKKYKFDYRMFGLLDPNEFSAILFPAKNPDFGENADAIVQAGLFVHNNRIHVRYGSDTTIYKINEELNLERTSYIAPKPPLDDLLEYGEYDSDSLNSKKFQANLVKMHYNLTLYSDVFPLKDSPYAVYFRYVPRIYSKKEIGERREYLVYMDLIDENLEILKTVKMSEKNLGYPPVYSNEKFLFYTVNNDLPKGSYEYLIMGIK